ncbi:unnamed protein product [Adineta steineri]|uniref:NHL repeat containing protein n=1 Tax=Adineta steineri TaxID=433720 RepID=A0A819L653_9BILA|nr:unnamed protein product [Adineta steineri]CAF4063339.1 unnamed protein product [Adineta steineri]
MVTIGRPNVWLILIIIGQVSAVSYNQPKFCSNVSWNQNATIFANSSTIGTTPYSIFINTDNTVYALNRIHNQIQIWLNDSINLTRTISGGFSNSWSFFVTTNGDIYVDNTNASSSVDKWALNSNSSVPVMYVSSACYSLFVDINDTLYCSINALHQVVTKSLNNVSNMTTIVAGTGCPGSISNMLYNPRGIFVNTNLDLYIADYTNNRIQLYQSGQLSGTTVTGVTSSTTTITLYQPTGIVLDTDNYLFIVDRGYQRIVGEGPNGFRCIIGCSGSSLNQLNSPQAMAFDSNGNIFVIDSSTNQIVKFDLLTNFCDEVTTTEKTITVTMNNVTSASNIITSQSNNLIINSSKIVSYNQPKFCQNTSWEQNSTTFASNSTSPYSIFINTNNIVYVVDRINNRIQAWFNGSINPTTIISTNLSNPFAFFVTTTGDIYIDNGGSNGRVDKWALNSNISVPAMYISKACYGLFIDINDTLYCSMNSLHQVVTKSIHSVSNTLTLVAGTGCSGSASNMLYNPHGIFVDINLNLYVADYGNNRIQFYQSGQLSGITITGNGSSITLFQPTGIVLDADNYLFIVDSGNNRIIGEGPNGFHVGYPSSRFDYFLSRFV